MGGAVGNMVRTAAPSGQHILKGIPASPGVAIGKAYVLSVESPSITHERIEPSAIVDEVAQFRRAIETVTGELIHAVELARTESSTVSTIIESFQLIVADPTIINNIVRRIEQGTSAEAAVVNEFDIHKALLYNAKDIYLRERALDFEQVKERLLSVMRNNELWHAAAYDSILVAGSITPHDMLLFKQTRTLGYVTEVGGINSHACILARDLGVPAVIGIRNATGEVPMGATIIVDGFSGVVVVEPDAETLAQYHEKLVRAEEYKTRLGSLIGMPTVTQDGHAVRLVANIDTPEQVDVAVMQGSEGVGLVRTEYLLIQRGRYPSVDEQTEWYRDIAHRAFPLPVTFRAFDVGSDKFREGIPHHEDNPALGLRGIRFLLYRPDIFRCQVCAVLRASAHKNVRLMLPMISVMEELEQARYIIEECKHTLAMDGVDFDPRMPVGMMIETPAAAMMADSFAKHVDFMSIGTNDLAQYALATDRTNELVADLFDALHPAVIRMIAMVVDAGRRHNTTVSICGELAGHAAATELLLGLGIHELSVSPALTLQLKHRIREATLSDSVELTARVLRATSTPEVYALLAGGRS